MYKYNVIVINIENTIIKNVRKFPCDFSYEIHSLNFKNNNNNKCESLKKLIYAYFF
jgi:hypothetical protein